MERSRIHDLILPTSIISLLVLSFGAFSRQSRLEILRRDNRTCQNCGKRERDGYRLDAAHYNHDYSNPNYDSPENGRALCLNCHAQESLESGDLNAYHLIMSRIREKGEKYEQAERG